MVCAEIQLAVSESSAHFFSHRLAIVHVAGMWSWLPHLHRRRDASWVIRMCEPLRSPFLGLRGVAYPKQNALPHSHLTVGTMRSSCVGLM